MGSWGTGILQDDIVLDIIDELKNYLKETQSIEQSTNRLIESNKELIEDSDDGPLFWMALAKCQWEYGALDKEVLKQVKEDFNEEKGLDLWKEESKKDYLKRKKAIADFIAKLEEPNIKIKKLPKLIVRKPLFEEGDCLSLKVNDEYYGTAIVIRSDDSNMEYGSNLIVALKYWDKRQPTIHDFSSLAFLSLTYGNWNSKIHKAWYSSLGFRNYKNQIVKIGNIDVSEHSKLDSTSYACWNTLLHLVELQYKSKNTDK